MSSRGRFNPRGSFRHSGSSFFRGGRSSSRGSRRGFSPFRGLSHSRSSDGRDEMSYTYRGSYSRMNERDGNFHERDEALHYRESRRDDDRVRRSYESERRYEGRPFRENRSKSPYDRDHNRGMFHESPNYKNDYRSSPKRKMSPYDYDQSKTYKRSRIDSQEHAYTPRERSHDEEHHRSHDYEQHKESHVESDEHSGVQITIRADGERAVNSEGRARPHPIVKVFVDLKCPHCYNQHSITFKEYKYHLMGRQHKNAMHQLSRKHSMVLRNIRLRQRTELKELEDKWELENKNLVTVTRFCSTCKLAFKCPSDSPSEGIEKHNQSKFHKMQLQYLHSNCNVCKIKFSTRMIYEHHIASISHLQMLSTLKEKNKESEKESDATDKDNKEEEEEEFDLSCFTTLDSVGDDDDIESEHEDDITGGLNAEEMTERAKSEQEEIGDDLDVFAENKFVEEKIRTAKPGGVHSRLGLRLPKKVAEGKVEVSADVPEEVDYDEAQMVEEASSEKPLGVDYVKPVEAYFCNLCYKVFINESSDEADQIINKHCSSLSHLTLYHEKHLTPSGDIEENEERTGEHSDEIKEKDVIKERQEENVTEENVHDEEQECAEAVKNVDNFWEDVDRGLQEIECIYETEEPVSNCSKEVTLKENAGSKLIQKVGDSNANDNSKTSKDKDELKFQVKSSKELTTDKGVARRACPIRRGSRRK